jgi:cytochrome c553
VPERDIPDCIECHGPADGPKNPTYPRLTGQHVSYLVQQLQLLQERRRGGSSNVDLMNAFVQRLQPSEIRDVTLYYGSVSPPRATAAGVRDTPDPSPE